MNKEETYLVKMYHDKLDDKVKEYVFRCLPSEIDEFTKKEVKMFVLSYNLSPKDVIIFKQIKYFK